MSLLIFKLFIFVVASLTVTANAFSLTQGNLNSLYEWKVMDFLWDSPEDREEAVKNGSYNPKRIVPMDVAKARGQKQI